RYVVNFIKILCERKALSLLEGCTREYRELLYEARGILPVTAQSAVELTSEQTQRLQTKLEAITGKKILLTSKVDKLLIAGIRISYEGRMLDGTVKQRFEALQKTLITA
ncbi:MAG: ATP synthase F1 subunit delta, partial [Oscillospiraceae bacterium]